MLFTWDPPGNKGTKKLKIKEWKIGQANSNQKKVDSGQK